jgi:hypothetical protein
MFPNDIVGKSMNESQVIVVVFSLFFSVSRRRMVQSIQTKEKELLKRKGGKS